MSFKPWFIILTLYLLHLKSVQSDSVSSKLNKTSERLPPTVMITVLSRNKAHTLPYFLTLLERLDYPKSRISLWIRSDHNKDNTIEILREWISEAHKSYDYHSINSEMLSSPPFSLEGETEETQWPPARFTHLIQLKEEALQSARQIWADYIWFLDSDVFLTEPKTLSYLMSKDFSIVAPMLSSDGMYSNFWCGMTDDFYYRRTEQYQPIYYREQVGCFSVPMVHSAVLVDLRNSLSTNLTFVPEMIPSYTGPNDDIIAFAVGANKTGLSLNVCNDRLYGFVMIPMERSDDQERDYLVNLKMEVLVDMDPLPLSKTMAKFVDKVELDTVGFDEIFVINLERRTERRLRMERSLQEIGLSAKFVKAVDGKTLDDSTVQQMGIKLMPEYSDPYKKRPMTMGEIGCFLSHYNIWKEMVANRLSAALILEDDIRFESFFRRKLDALMEELREKRIIWDMIYLGRKRLVKEEPWAGDSRLLVEPGYSYWTLGYMLTLTGARKLLAAKPLENLLPVDEFFPILFDQHPEETWKVHFPDRNLRTLSAAPLLLYPTHYTGDQGYVSDTEDSDIISEPLGPHRDERDRRQPRTDL